VIRISSKELSMQRVEGNLGSLAFRASCAKVDALYTFEFRALFRLQMLPPEGWILWQHRVIQTHVPYRRSVPATDEFAHG
jgi:hypothetical protein